MNTDAHTTTNEKESGEVEKFEVNLTEALIGWRQWLVNGDRLISPVSGPCIWVPEKKVSAVCMNFGGAMPVWPPTNTMEIHDSPHPKCNCGIYGRDAKLQDTTVGIIGQVYGWGRYVRGDAGWRAQYAYPKSFFVNCTVNPETIEILKQYRVPIYFERPTLLYSPEEDGYEYRGKEENWNSGTDALAAADEENH